MDTFYWWLNVFDFLYIIHECKKCEFFWGGSVVFLTLIGIIKITLNTSISANSQLSVNHSIFYLDINLVCHSWHGRLFEITLSIPLIPIISNYPKNWVSKSLKIWTLKSNNSHSCEVKQLILPSTLASGVSGLNLANRSFESSPAWLISCSDGVEVAGCVNKSWQTWMKFMRMHLLKSILSFSSSCQGYVF